MKKAVYATAFALALSAGVVSVENLQCKETLQKLMAKPYYKALGPSSQRELFRKVLEANSPDLAAISNIELREFLTGLTYRRLDGKSIDDI